MTKGNGAAGEARPEGTKGPETLYEELIAAAKALKEDVSSALESFETKKPPYERINQLHDELAQVIANAENELSRVVQSPSASEERKWEAVTKLRTKLVQIFNNMQLLNTPSVIDFSRSQNFSWLFDRGSDYGSEDDD